MTVCAGSAQTHAMDRNIEDVWQVVRELSDLLPIRVFPLLTPLKEKPAGLHVQIGESIFVVYPEPNEHVKVMSVSDGRTWQVPKGEAAAHIFLQLI